MPQGTAQANGFSNEVDGSKTRIKRSVGRVGGQKTVVVVCQKSVGDGALKRPGAGQRVPAQMLQRGDGRFFAEYGVNRHRFGRVVVMRTRSVRTDEVDLIGSQTGGTKRFAHAGDGSFSFRMRGGDMVCVARFSPTADTNVGRFSRQQQKGSAFAEIDAGAFGAKRKARLVTHGAQRVESRGRETAGSVDAPRDDGVDQPRLQQANGGDDGHGARGARIADRVDGARDAEFLRDESGGLVQVERSNVERIGHRALKMTRLHGRFRFLEAGRRRAENNADSMGFEPIERARLRANLT